MHQADCHCGAPDNVPRVAAERRLSLPWRDHRPPLSGIGRRANQDCGAVRSESPHPDSGIPPEPQLAVSACPTGSASATIWACLSSVPGLQFSLWVVRYRDETGKFNSTATHGPLKTASRPPESQPRTAPVPGTHSASGSRCGRGDCGPGENPSAACRSRGGRQ